ncbi:hypothetical protein AWN76_017175 [Rhodothermaceae bacterium RA]|nr:hypothetical protein AWN76_017175 [Rhodothermaceae bacterium RA]
MHASPTAPPRWDQSLHLLIRIAIVAFLSLLGARTILAQPAEYQAVLSSSNQVPAIESGASGMVTATLDGMTLTISGSFSGLQSALATEIAGGAHLHIGYAGQSGPVAFPLTVTADADARGGTLAPADNTFELTPEQIAALEARRIYVNIHSMDHPGGELRGQLIPASAIGFRATLSGGNEVPANTSAALGTVIGELDGMTLTISGAFSGLSSNVATEIAGGAHLHLGYAGENGPVIVPLTATFDADNRGGIFAATNNTFTLTAEQVAALEGRQIYVNIHSMDHPGGELRGQLIPASSIGFKAILAGSNAIPATTSSAMGTVVAELNDTTLTVSGRFSGLESALATEIAGGAHLHLGYAGQNGPVAFPLTVTADVDARGGTVVPADNTFELTPEQAAMLQARGIYVNIHSMDHPGGEIRGQLLSTASASFTAMLDGSNEIPANGSRGHGQIVAELSGTRLIVSGAFAGMESDFNADIAGGAHLHTGMAGENGGVGFALTTSLHADQRSGVFEPGANTFELSADALTTLQARGLYANIHSMAIASGELRGQLIPTASVQLRAVFSGRAELPANTSQALGGAIVEVMGDQLILSGAFSGLESELATDVAGGAHLHLGALDANGDVVFALASDLDSGNRSGVFAAANNQFMLDAAQRSALLDGRFYVNIHTSNHPGGELRGQVLPMTSRVLEATLSSQNEVPAIEVDGMGGVIAVLDGTTLTVAGRFGGLASAVDVAIAGGAHLHAGPPDANGDVVFALDATLDADRLGGLFEAANNRFELTEEQVALLLNGGLYVNIHTLENASGALRGQVLASANVAPDAPAIDTPNDGATIAIEGDPGALFTATWTGGDANGNALYHTWQLATSDTFEDGTILLEADTGTDTMFSTTIGDIATLLTSAGVEVGSQVTLYHRANSTDGSQQRMGEPAMVILERGTVTSTETGTALPERFELLGAYPNPFNPTTTIRFALPSTSEVQIAVFNTLGQQVRTLEPGRLSPGLHSVTFNAVALPSGLYLYRLTARADGEAFVETGRMMMVK